MTVFGIVENLSLYGTGVCNLESFLFPRAQGATICIRYVPTKYICFVRDSIPQQRALTILGKDSDTSRSVEDILRCLYSLAALDSRS